MQQLSVDQAKGRLKELVDAALGGETIILETVRHGEVPLVPMMPEKATPQFGSAKEMIEMAEDFDAPLEDFREYMEHGT